jgi:hypothetical protein
MMYFKRHICCFFALLLLSLTTKAQTLKEFFNHDTVPLTYLGVDFSLAKVQGETAIASQMRDKFEEINNVITNEQKKYDVAGSFRRGHVTNELTTVNKLNAARNTETLKTDDVADMEKNALKPEDVEKHVKSYDLSGKKCIGLVFIMDGMSKTNKEATMYVTLLDLSSKKVLLTKRMTGKAQGFGFRNYWAYTVYKVLHDIDKDDYSDWKKDALAAPDVKEEPVEVPKKAVDTLKTTKPPKAKKVVKKA